MSRSALAVGLFAASLYPLIAWHAVVRAPTGHVFLGNPSSHEDICSYLGYAQQVSEGSFVFRSKLTTVEHQPALVNLEWAAMGALSWALGDRPFTAFRLFGAFGVLLMAGLVEAWLLDCGLPRRRRLAGLLLVFTGGGLGGLFLTPAWPEGLRPFDLFAGFYPFLMAIGNPHFVVGTTLVLAALHQLSHGRVGRGVALCAALALIRPYDCVLVVGADVLAVTSSTAPKTWLRRLAPWVALAPVLAYVLWLFLVNPAYATFSYGAPQGAVGLHPSLAEMALALGPAALLALTATRAAPTGASARRYLALWAALAAAFIALRPVSFSLQFGAGIGVPLLCLAAVGLAGRFRGALEIATVLLAGSLLFVMRVFWVGLPTFYVPDTSWRAARELRAHCRPGERLVAPREVGLLAEVFTSCSLYLPYSRVPQYAEKQLELDGFYGSWLPAQRAELLQRSCADHVVLPSGELADWLGPDAPFALSGAVSGAGPPQQLASRTRPCRGAP
ncbi:MAG: hypothetical protein AB7O37_10175 [Vicinamibacteria bacterium]